MKLLSLQIPDLADERTEWFDRQIVSPELADLTAQLSLESDEQPLSLDGVLGQSLPKVLEAGLAAATQDEMDELIRHPSLLLDLQTRVLLNGGSYWDSLSAEASKFADTAIPTDRKATGLSVTPDAPRRSMRWIAIGFALAASVALILTLRPAPQPAGWGFDRPGVLAADTDSATYLSGLADAADDWFNKTPTTQQALASRLKQFQAGCDTLLAADHTPLNEEQREWLLERCRAWRGAIDTRLEQLASGEASLNETQQESDALIRRMITALNDKAAA